MLDVRTDVFTYLKGHLPGAEYLNTETVRASEGGIPTRLLLRRRLSRAVRAARDRRIDQPVVIYSAGETRNIDATFVAWLLAGVRPPEGLRARRRVLQVAARAAAGGAAVPQDPCDARFPTEPFRPEAASLEDVQAGPADRRRSWWTPARPISTPARPAHRCGTGIFPGPISHYWQDDLTQEGFGHVWKSARRAARSRTRRRGSRPDKDIIAYCNSATEASHVHFTLRYLLGYPRVRIYVGSWTEWAENTSLPVEMGRKADTTNGR